jgi:hypothetical protein
MDNPQPGFYGRAAARLVSKNKRLRAALVAAQSYAIETGANASLIRLIADALKE